MDDNGSTSQELLAELAAMRRRVLRLEEELAGRRREKARPGEDSLLDQMTDGMIIIARDGTIRFANAAARKLVELDSSATNTGRNVAEFLTPAGLPGVQEALLLAHEGREGARVECLVVSTGGRETWIEATGKKIRFGNDDCRLINMRDITDRREAEKIVVQSEKKFASIFHFNPHPILIIELSTAKIMDVNRAFTGWTGYTREEAIGSSTVDLRLWTRPEERGWILGALKAEGEVSGREVLMSGKNGVVRNVLFCSRSIEIGDKRCLLTMLQDITESTRTHQALADAQKRFLQVMENTGEVIWEVDAEGRLQYCSPAVERILGYDPGELLGQRHSYELYAPDVERLLKLEPLSQLRSGKPFVNYIAEVRHKNGGPVTLEISGTPVLDECGNLLGFRGTALDITARRRAEAEREKIIAQLQQALSEVKTLSGLLPICASCKKIRDDSGYWNQIESYIRARSGAEFTHGICPDCLKKLYPHYCANI